MKFNFEKAKDIIKKTTVGAGIVTASLSSLKSNAQEIKQDQDTIKNKTEISMDPEYYRNEYIKYMEHPSYKVRLAKEMYGDEVIDEEKQKNIDKTYEDRVNKIKNISIEMMPNVEDPLLDSSYYSILNKSVKTTPRASSHELTHSLDHIGNFMARQKGFEDKKNEFLDLKKILKKYNYMSKSTEIKARLNSLRIKAINMYGFDLNNEFDINNYEKLREDKEYEELRFNLNLTNEQINELMKYTAMNERENDTYYHPDWNYYNNNNQS